MYDEGHLRHLEAIAKLQDRGLNLRTIRDALRQNDRCQLSLQDWLGVEADLSAPWLDESPLLLDETALHERLGDSSPKLRAALERAGLFERQGRGSQRRYLVRSPGMLEIALRLNAAGVDVASGVRADQDPSQENPSSLRRDDPAICRSNRQGVRSRDQPGGGR